MLSLAVMQCWSNMNHCRVQYPFTRETINDSILFLPACKQWVDLVFEGILSYPCAGTVYLEIFWKQNLVKILMKLRSNDEDDWFSLRVCWKLLLCFYDSLYTYFGKTFPFDNSLEMVLLLLKMIFILHLQLADNLWKDFQTFLLYFMKCFVVGKHCNMVWVFIE